MSSFRIGDPGVVSVLDPGAGLLIQPFEEKERPTLGDTLRAAAEQENIIFSALAQEPLTGDEDPDFFALEVVDPTKTYHPTQNPYLHIDGFDEFAHQFLRAKNARDADIIKGQIQREQDNRRTLDEAGAVGMIAMVGAAILDPLIFVPGFGIVKGVRGVNAVRTALKFSAVGGGIIGVQEAALHQSQRTRTQLETALNITGGTILSGMIGGAIGKLAGRTRAQAAAQLDEIAQAVDPPRARQPTSPIRDGPEAVTPETAALRSELLSEAKAPRADIVAPVRVNGPNELRPGQTVDHPKFGEGKVESAPGHKEPSPGDRMFGVSRFNAKGRGVHDGQIRRLKGFGAKDPHGIVRILKVFRVQGRGVTAANIAAKGDMQIIGLNPAGKVSIKDWRGVKRVINLEEIRGVERIARGDTFNTGGANVIVEFQSGMRTVKADLLTTRETVAGKPARHSLNGSFRDVLDNTVDDPLEPYGIDLDAIGPVRLPDPAEVSTPLIRPVRPGGEPIPVAAPAATRAQFPGVKFLGVDSLTDVTDVAIAATGGAAVEGSLGFNKIAKWINPRLQLFMSRNNFTKRVADFLIQSPVKLKGVKALDAESIVRIKRADARNTMIEVDDLYAKYATGDPNARLKLRNRFFGMRRQRDRISMDRFQEEISKSMRGQAGPDGRAVNVDVHEIAEVEQAAKLIRARILNPIRDDLINLGVLPAEIRDFPGYLTRLYNHELLRTTAVVGGKVQFVEREAFIDAVVAYRQKTALAKGELETFDDEGVRKAMQAVVDKLTDIPEGRLFPGDIPFRGPMLERTLDIPDEIISRWLVNDNERIINHYVRSLVGDTEIIRRFGLVTAKARLDEGRSSLVASIRKAADQREGVSLLKTRDDELSKLYGGANFKKALRNGRSRKKNPLRNNLEGRSAKVKAILKAKSEGDALKALEASDERLMAEFSTGNMELALDRVQTQWRKKKKATSKTDSKKAKREEREMNRDLANLRLARDEVRGMASLPNDPTRIGPRALKLLRIWTYVALGGKIALSSIPDLALPLVNHGLVDPRAFGKFTAGLLTDWNGIKLGIEDARLASGPSELVTNQRANRLFDLEDDLLPRTKLETGAQKGIRAYSLANLMSPWNEAVRMLSALTGSAFIISSARKVAGGAALSKGARGRLAEMGFDDAMLKRIAGQFEAHAGQGAGRGSRKVEHAPNTGAWTDVEATTAFRVAIERGIELNVIKGGPLDRPKFLRNASPALGDELSKTVFFFLNFGLSANVRVLARGLQYRDAAVINGMILGTGLGMLSVYLKWKSTGQRKPPWDDLTGFVAKGFEQSGFSGFIFDADRYIEAASSGKYGISALLGTRGARYYSPEDLKSAIFGLPLGRTLPEAGIAAADFLDLDVEPSNVRRLRRLMPLNNHFLLSRAIDQIQKTGEKSAR